MILAAPPPGWLLEHISGTLVNIQACTASSCDDSGDDLCPEHRSRRNLHTVAKFEIGGKVYGQSNWSQLRETTVVPCDIAMYPHVLNSIIAIGRPGRAHPMISSLMTLRFVYW